MTFAAKTKVAVATTRQQIEAALRRAGASRVITIDEEREAIVAFRLADRMIRMTREIVASISDQERRTLWRNIDQVVRGKLAGIQTAEESHDIAALLPGPGKTEGGADGPS